jgi:hypothetical protein
VNSDCTGTFTSNFKDNRPTVVKNFVVAQVEIRVSFTGSIGKRRFSKR